jgi:5-methylthioadenosine/S-adenosylhomocysteine deaminase
MWAIGGRLVPLASDPAVAPNETAVFTGKVWMSDDGIIVAVTRGSQPGPAGSEAAAIIDVGSSLVFPGLIDLHNHLAYNTLPLWTEPGQQTPFLHHNSWTRAKTYAASTTWPRTR